jgi:hypothetical protein
MSHCDAQELRRQLRDETAALKRMSSGKPTAVVALMPESMAGRFPTALRWERVRDGFERGATRLQRLTVDHDLLRGYLQIAEQMVARVESHSP